MEIAKWKFPLSYLFDFKVHELVSEKNGKMKLFLSNREYKLTTKNAIYSFGKKYSSFGNSIDQLKLVSNSNISSVLVLGWAMGSISRLLEKSISIKQITGVEYDEILVEAYEKYFKNQYNFKEKLFVADAIEFIKKDQSTYDLICSDVFNDNVTPDEVISKENISNINKRLNKNGFALLSKLNRTVADVNQNKELENNLASIIGKFNCIKTFGNSIYYWQKTN